MFQLCLYIKSLFQENQRQSHRAEIEKQNAKSQTKNNKHGITPEALDIIEKRKNLKSTLAVHRRRQAAIQGIK